MVQDYPPISGFAMEPTLLARLAREIPSARTIKLEDPPTPFKTARILEQAQGLPVQIFGGLGGVFLLEELMSGATGAMTGFAFLPKKIMLLRISSWPPPHGDSQARRRTTMSNSHTSKVSSCLWTMRSKEFPGTRDRPHHIVGARARARACGGGRALADLAATRAPAGRLDAPTERALDRVLAWGNFTRVCVDGCN